MRPIKSIGQLALVVDGSLVLILGVLWALFIVTMMIFGGIDLSERSPGGRLGSTTGSVMMDLAMIGVLIAIAGGVMFTSAWRYPTKRSER